MSKKKSDPKSELTRREFLKKSAEYSAYLASLSTGLVAFTNWWVNKQAYAGASSFVADAQVFEYIVVGSGAGGGPVAANLAKAGHSVLLLEAGGGTTPLDSAIPAFHALSTEDPAMSWQFFVNHYTNAERQRRDSKFVPGEGGVLYPRSGTLGGCTAHNAMVTLYPDNRDWNDIVKLTGDRSWNARDMRRYFERLENVRYAKKGLINSERHGFDGWLSVEQSDTGPVTQDGKLLDLVLSAAQQEGVLKEVFDSTVLSELALNLDPNDWRYVRNKVNGIYRIPKATFNGRRSGTRELVLQTRERFPQNLFLQTHSLATRLLFDENKTTRAVGIEYLKGAHLYRADPNASGGAGVRQRAFAKKEVILAGGAFNSPQLLMLSGVGAREELDRMGIAQRVNLPGVGKNLQDHYEVSVVTELKEDFKFLEKCTFGGTADPCLVDYDKNPAKALYGSNGVLISLINKSGRDKHHHDICLFGIPGRFRGYYPGWSKDALTKNQFSWAILRGYTGNTAGTVGLRSADPRDTPEINFRYFDEGTDPGDDVEALLKGITIARQINGRSYVKKSVSRELLPGPAVQSDGDVRQFIRDEAWGHHASCSNKMGPATDPLAVVDSKFRVHGLDNVRVVDASVFPRIPGLFIVVPIYMIAEKASDEILADSQLF